MKIFNSLATLLILVSLFGLFPKISPAFAASLNLSNDRVQLSASDFSITTGGKTYVGGGINLHSDPGTPAYTTLEATWQEQGVEMRLYMYFGVENGQWKVTEIRTYNGASPSSDWLYYNGFTGGALGSTYTNGNLDLNSTSGAGTGALHFSNLSLKPSFVTQDYAITVTSPNGGEHLTPGSNYTISWNFANPNRTDLDQTFGTSIYLQKPDGTNVATIVNNQNITKFNSNSYNWVVPSVARGDYKIYVYMNTQFSTSTGTQNLNDKSDNVFTIQSSTSTPTSTNSPTATPTPIKSGPTPKPTFVNSPTQNSLKPTPTPWRPKPAATINPENKKDATGSAGQKNNANNSNQQKNVFIIFIDWIKVIFHFKQK